MFDLSHMLYELSGNFEKHSQTGVTLDADAVRWVMTALTRCADQAKCQAEDAAGVARELEAAVHERAPQAPPPLAPWLGQGRPLVIQGGRA